MQTSACMLILRVMGLQVGFACTVTRGQRSPYHSPGQYKLSRRLPPQQLLPHNTEYSGHSPHTDKLSVIAHITPPHLRRESTNTPTPEFSIYSYSGGRNPFFFLFFFFSDAPTLHGLSARYLHLITLVPQWRISLRARLRAQH